ncbi:hypothetical protein NM688_g8362 [Phlebia brevispora]|uniref:Uncharacterized protein n=1 Tax=Phlebia brevispora TaxID=194682 RepID=A0ACC1RUT8_9APHY|nr:hypothetical protein NM688_g8362 [Phlebia brevispora]
MLYENYPAARPFLHFETEGALPWLETICSHVSSCYGFDDLEALRFPVEYEKALSGFLPAMQNVHTVVFPGISTFDRDVFCAKNPRMFPLLQKIVILDEAEFVSISAANSSGSSRSELAGLLETLKLRNDAKTVALCLPSRYVEYLGIFRRLAPTQAVQLCEDW